MALEEWLNGKSWVPNTMGPPPTEQNLADAGMCISQPYTLGGLALAMTFREGGSTRSQRIAATGGQRDNIGILAEIRRATYGTRHKFQPGKPYPLTVRGRTVELRVVGSAGHWKAKIVKGSAATMATPKTTSGGRVDQGETVPVVLCVPRDLLAELLRRRADFQTAGIEALREWLAQA